jgi:hypothetical protein
MLPLRTPTTKGKAKETNASIVGRHLTDLAKNGCENGISTPNENYARMILPSTHPETHWYDTTITHCETHCYDSTSAHRDRSQYNFTTSNPDTGRYDCTAAY